MNPSMHLESSRYVTRSSVFVSRDIKTHAVDSDPQLDKRATKRFHGDNQTTSHPTWFTSQRTTTRFGDL